MGRPYATVYGWLLRIHERGLNGRVDRTSPNRKKILDRDACRLILEWISGSPQDYNFGSGIWQTSMIISMIRDRMGINVHSRTLRRGLQHVSISFRKPKIRPAQLRIRTGAGRVQEEYSGDGRPAGRRARRLVSGRDDSQTGGGMYPGMDAARDQPHRQDRILQKVDQSVRCPESGQATHHARRSGKLDNAHLWKHCARSMAG